MNQIQVITADPSQTQAIPIQDGSSFTFTLYYVDLQYGWWITNFTYGDFVLQGFRVFNSPNMLQQYRNQIPFGLACYTVGQREPTQLQDFSSEASTLWVLTQAEVAQFNTFLTTGVGPG